MLKEATVVYMNISRIFFEVVKEKTIIVNNKCGQIDRDDYISIHNNEIP